MNDKFELKIIADFSQEIAAKLHEAAIIARTASDLAAKGLPERAFVTLLGTEELIHDASTLLNASSIVHRRERHRVSMPPE